ncbi:SIMPL domain-containing protein [Paractinoplanes lichenicola]|uniref:SIMPL domain-containing protein n=1 Tax=Paractinoplanes lichenicola TaxID=2802976 RepID=A0ABS1VN53_9ACTN|nr:SIMPL domain-containing protein [Actinoplanes lichenicola]MBL7254926.1 SIMPL domain-containing protein [Actinoplanes lichenicola]
MVEQPVIVVRGEAFREVPPEQALLTVTLSARDREREAVVSRLLERSRELHELLAQSGEAIERRETGGVHVLPELKRGSERVVAYTGSIVTTITVVDFEPLGQLLLHLARLEHAAVSGPWWQLRPGSRAGAEVRREAITDALARAREYAAAVGAEVDRLVEIADEGAGGGGQPMMRMAAFDAGAPESAGFDVDPQPQSVQASVIVRVTITDPDLGER